MNAISDFFARHRKVAFELSGGKDSTAALYALESWWPQMTVYWCNPGRPAPEVQQHVYRIAQHLPHFVEVPGRRNEVWAKDGWPSDLIPIHFVPFGQLVRGAPHGEPAIQGRYDCCTRSLMNPLHERVLADGNTGIVRGQKDADELKGSLRSGAVHEGIEYLYPIEGWSNERVLLWLANRKISLPESYQHLDVSPDCLDCTAWWGERRSVYLKERHPEEFKKYQIRLRYIRSAIAQHLDDLNKEVM